MAFDDATLTALETMATSGLPPTTQPDVFDVGSGPFLDVVEDELFDRLVSRGAATCRFVEGPYGAGKTHLLRLMTRRALDRGMAVLSAELSADLNIESWDAVTRFVLQRIQFHDGDQLVTGLPAVLRALGARDIDQERLASMPAPHPSFRNAMLVGLRPDALTRETASLLDRYLEGQRIASGKLRMAGIRDVKDPLSKRNAEHVLNTALMTLYGLGVPGTVLAFDETERTLVTYGYAASRKVRVAANLMRRMIDACPTGRVFGALVVFAVLPDFLERSAMAYPALGQRLRTRLTTDTTPWRSPVLRVDDIGIVTDPEAFLEHAAARFSGIPYGLRDADRESLRTELVRAGAEVLEKHAGSGYRRPLMKQLAATTLARMEDIE